MTLRTTAQALSAFSIGLAGSLAAGTLLKRYPPGGAKRWDRPNHAGQRVTLLEGPAFVVSAVSGALVGGAGAQALIAGLGAGALGGVDDLLGEGPSKGLRGHLGSALRGEVTTGVVKIVGLGVTGLLAAGIIDRSKVAAPRVSTMVGGAVIAGSANLVNLFDLRPGRALKVVLMLAVPLAATGSGNTASKAAAGAAAGAAIGCLPGDLAGRSMLGDTGANSAGALLGTALVGRTGLAGRLGALALLTALTLASERVSFTAVIEATPGLRELDALGRSRR
ncbi:MAG: hypothetical protein ABI934_04825 [Actinomycetota bacterium]